MRLTHADIIKFQKLYGKYFNTSLNSADAHQQLALLVRQLEIIYQPITTTQLSTLNNEDEELKNVSGEAQPHVVERS